MTKIKIIFEEEFNKFEPGESVIYEGRICVVSKWLAPLCAGEDATVFLIGYPWGVSASECREVKDGSNRFSATSRSAGE
jgi:hypothetical protein